MSKRKWLLEVKCVDGVGLSERTCCEWVLFLELEKIWQKNGLVFETLKFPNKECLIKRVSKEFENI